VERIKRTRFAARVAKVGNGEYGRPHGKGPPKFLPPPPAELGDDIDSDGSAEEDGFLGTDDLAADLASLPMAAARSQALSRQARELEQSRMRPMSRWPPRVSKRTAGVSLLEEDSFGPRQELRRTFVAGAIVTQLARESVSSPREEQGSLRASLRSTSSVVRRSDSAEMGSDVNRLPRPNLPAESSGAGEPCGSRLWHSRRERQQRYKERIWAAFGDRDMEEGIDGSVARFRQEILPRRQCYSSHEMLSRRMNHRRMAHAAEPGPEIGRGLLSSHAVRTAEQVELEMVLFQRRLDTMLRAASGAAPAFNLGMSISSERLFGFLLVALPSYPQVQTLDLSRNSLDDGHMERLSETLMEAGSVTSLDVSYNRLTWLSALALGKLLVKRPRDLGGAHRQLSTLRMDGNHIGSRGTEVLVEALTKNRHLKKLGLQKCAVGPAGGRKLGQLLSETSIVAELDVSWNELGLHGAQHLLSALRVSPCLEVLNLSHNFLGDEEGEQLFEALAHNERLRCLDVSSNFLGPRACASLAEALLANPLTRLEQLTVDDNPCGLRGGVSLLSLLDEGSTTAAIEISAKGCSFAQEAPKEDFDPLEPEGLYHLKLGHEEQRAAAIALLEARNAHSPSAWKVSRLNGKQWRPPGPWSPAPLVRATETNAQEAAPKKKRRKAASRKGQRAAAADAGRASAAPRTTQKGGQAAGGDGEEEPQLDPRDPRAAVPPGGDLVVEFRSTALAPAGGDGALPSGMPEGFFRRAWRLQGQTEATDGWRLELVVAISRRHAWTVPQAVAALGSFLHRKEKLQAAAQIFRCLEGYHGAHAIHAALSESEWCELYESLGLCRIINPSLLPGGYSLDLRMRVDNYAAHLLQHFWWQEAIEQPALGESSPCWRNVRLDGAPARATPTCRLPCNGRLSLDYATWRPPDPQSGHSRPLTDRAFRGLMLQLTRQPEASAMLGRQRLVAAILAEDAPAAASSLPPKSQNQVPKPGGQESSPAGRGAASQSGARSGKGGQRPSPSTKKAAKPPAEGSGSWKSGSVAESRPPVPKNLAKVLHQASQDYGFVENAAAAMDLIRGVLSRCTVDHKQALVLLQAFEPFAAERVEVFKMMFRRILDHSKHALLILRYGLKAEERKQVISAIGILSLVNWDNPSGLYELSTAFGDHRFCLFRLLKLAIAGGKVDVRMFQELRVGGEAVATAQMQSAGLWSRMLGPELWQQLELHVAATATGYEGLWDWLDAGAGNAAALRAEAGTRALAAREAGNVGGPGQPPLAAEEEEEELTVWAEGETPAEGGGVPVSFVFEVRPEARFAGIGLVASRRWRSWARRRREERERAAVARIWRWYNTQKERAKLREMRKLLHLESSASDSAA